MRIAHVSTLPDMRCGIAVYASDLIEALPGRDHRRFALHYGQNLTPDTAGDCNVRDFRAVAALARSINASDAQVVCLQHEFGIWGGLNGPHLCDCLDALDRPVVSTIHTTIARGAWPAMRLHGLRTLIERSGAAFVLSESSRRTLCAALGIPTSRVGVLPHGVPAVGLAPPAPLTDEAGTQRWRFCSLGFFRPDKGWMSSSRPWPLCAATACGSATSSPARRRSSSTGKAAITTGSRPASRSSGWTAGSS